MKKLCNEQLYQIKMNFFSEVSVKVLALKMLVTIFILPTLFKCIDELTIASHNIFVDVMLSTLVIIIPSLLLILLFKKEISIFEKVQKRVKNQIE
ncbi:MAG: hypothetical protein E6663_10460 [Staphylococcus lugdunensis]|nr:hypothetical protein [Staphylococcus lugdunensis]